MPKLFKTYLGSIVLSAFPVVSQAYSEWVQSIFQEEEKYWYVAIGGGGAGQFTDTWHLTNPNLFNTLSTGFTNITINQPNDDSDFVGVGLLAVGYTFPGAPLRLEVAYNYIGDGKYTWDNLFQSSTPPLTETESMTGEARIYSNTVMLNGYLDFMITEQFIPYIMAGFGWGLNSTKFNWDYIVDDVSLEGQSDAHNKSNLVWNAGIGAMYGFNDAISLGIQFTYVGLGKAEINAKPYSVNDNNSDESFMEINDLSAVTGTINLTYHFGV